MNIFKGLESVNWSTLKHNGQAGSIVVKFLEEVISDDSRARSDALVFLLGKGDYGPKFGYDFFSTTPYIVTALLNILSDAEIAEVVKSSILEDLYYVFKVSADAFQIGPNKAFRFPSSIEVNFERLNVAYEVYQILLNGENIYKQLLADASSRIRSDATSMLEILPIHSSEVIELLKQRIHIEPELHVRVGIACALSRKFKNIDYWLGCFTNEADIDFKRTLALIYIELLMGLRAEQNKQINLDC